ncbi:hypothetical protein GW835_04080 [archaeon]|nr:hypothetical protein [archaeon]NCP79717.1 hypothetical protein [archaeon]NCP98007.1 hypothetical protein [archaeon]NCQ07483.1 hypothetical protein [archaeon]NCQ51274.1 hypothetical protein [archaeon]
MISLNYKSISPLISVILLIVVSIAFIGVITNWSKSFVITNSEKVDLIKTNNSLDQFIVIDSFYDSEENSSIILKNNANKNIVLENYKFINGEGEFYNQEFVISGDDVLNKGNLLKIDLICFPSNNLDILFKTTDGDYFKVNLKKSILNINYCHNDFKNQKVYSFEELLEKNLLDVNSYYLDVNGDLNLPEIDDFIIKTKFKLDSVSGYQTLISYKYSGVSGYGSGQRGGFKFMVLPSGNFAIVGSQNGGSLWWGYSGGDPGQTPPLVSNKYYDLIYHKNGRLINLCLKDNIDYNSFFCNEPWYYPYYDITNIYYSDNPTYNYKSIIGATNYGLENTFLDYFNGSVEYIELYEYSEDNNISSVNNLPLNNYIFKIDLTK